MWQNHPHKSSSSSLRDSIVALEADIQHANILAASLPRGYGGDHIQMKLSYSPLAPLFLHLIQWMDFTCTDSLPTSLGLFHILIYKVYGDGLPSLSSKERKASLKDFYGVIYPSLRLLEGELKAQEAKDKGNNRTHQVVSRKSPNKKGLENKEQELRDDECGICMEMSMIMVLPNCGHSLCITCFHDWNVRSESCPFCRGSLKRVSSRDLWVVIDEREVADRVTVAKDNLTRFYLYMESLPLLSHDPPPHLFLFNYML
ncbi:E3 ubiquitin-protein ligase AIRP2 [Neltuma alba]|uniref:E3 ubiquitin-protein ligase AIRP2 n=1 Tax=Neltuma alba TaxID=207710 RepID=UPI0010A417B4|nr:E3 ubiquitin-protein ligase AIRP2-like [Prosopis alba]